MSVHPQNCVYYQLFIRHSKSSIIKFLCLNKMDISKVTNEKKLQLCRTYFIAGLAFLPFLWTINVFWFFNDAFRAPAFPEQKRIKKFVISSLIGALIWSVILITWIIIFQTKRAEWGEMADRMSFIIPLGIA